MNAEVALLAGNDLVLDEDAGIWRLSPEVSSNFHYSDGTEVEQHLFSVLRETADLGSQSVELAGKICDWPSEYHLSSKRANLLRGFDLSAVSSALEVGCGCGAITRYLGECGIAVDAVEGSRARAELAALRCRDLAGINLVCANFNELECPESVYDAVFLIGVTEYSARFMGNGLGDEEALLAMLRKAKKAVKDDGVVVIAIENRAGMKYVMGGYEDHYALRYVGVHNYPEPAGIRTYTRGEWLKILARSGFAEHELLLPFPDYKLPTVLLSEQYAADNPYAFCQLEGVPSREKNMPMDLKETESIFWEAANSTQTLSAYANSFCLVLSDSRRAIDRVAGFDFVHLPDFFRKREFCVMTKKRRGETLVRRSSLSTDGDAPTAGGVSQLVADEPFHHGPLLSLEWSRSLLIYEDCARFEEFLRRYYAFLVDKSASSEGINIDLLPNNIVVLKDGSYQAFDHEWQVEWPVEPGFVFYRALLGFVMKYVHSLQSLVRLKELNTVLDVIEYGFHVVGMDVLAKIDDYVAQDARFQAAVSVDFAPADLNTPIISAPAVRPNEAKVYWCGIDEAWSEDRSETLVTEEYDDRQVLVFDLPPEANMMSKWRYDPCDHRRMSDAGFLRIYQIDISAVAGDDGPCEDVWHARGQQDIAAMGKMSGMAFQSAGLGEVFMVINDDPHIEFQFIPRRELKEHEHLQIRVEMRLPRSVEYLLARDRHVIQQESYTRRLRYLEDVNREKEALEEELALIKSSKAWRLVRSLQGPVVSSLRRRIATSRALLREQGMRVAMGYAGKGLARSWRRLKGGTVPAETEPTGYERWLARHAMEFTDRLLSGASDRPLISLIMPVYDTDPVILQRAVDSVTSQSYDRWELCIADDSSTNAPTRDVLKKLEGGRIKVRFLDSNLGIAGATRAAVESACGDYIAFLDHDDELAPWALMEVAHAIKEQGPDLLYSDEDFIRTDGHLDFPHFKPDYSPDLLLSHNYITHLLVIERALYDAVGGVRDGYDGAQDYDLVLRSVECARQIVHLPTPMYHWRMSPESTSLNPQVKPGAHESARRALRDTLVRRGIDGEVRDANLDHFFRVKRKVRGEPLVSIILPFKDNPGLLRDCLETVLRRTSYQRFEIVAVSNDTMSPTTFDVMRELESRDDRVRFIDFDVPFNFSRIVNHGVGHARGDHFLLLNNDIEIITEEWLENLLEHSQREDVAAVGGKLYYPNNTVQHAGIMLGLGGYAGHVHKNFPATSKGYFNRLNVIQNVSAVTGALLMTSREVYETLGGFDEEAFGVAYNDVDFCLRARERGLLNVFTPYVEAYHHESISRGYEDTPEKQRRFEAEMKNLLGRHGDYIVAGDPYYNPNLDQGRDDFRLPGA